MKIFQCVQPLRLQRMDRAGNRTGADIEVPPGMAFTVYEEKANADPLQLEGLQGLRLTLSRKTVEQYFEEMV